MRVLARGYTLTTTQDGQPADLKKLQPGDRLVTRFADGTAESVVAAVRRKNPCQTEERKQFMASKKNPTFEQALTRLEEIAAGLEDGSMSLEESLKAYEEGVALVRLCQKTLEGAKLRLREQEPEAAPENSSDQPEE